MATSNQYNFPTIDADYIIRDAFERCGIENWKESGLRYQSAQRSLNFILSHWINLGLNLFTVEQGIIPIVSGQSRFELPQITLSKILECNLAKANQILGGTAATSSTVVSGSVESVFLALPGQCEVADIDANISYVYVTGQPILYVGIQSAATRDYTLFIECALTATPVDADWITILETPLTTYYLGQPVFYSLPYTKSALSWRIRETGGAILNIAQISLDIPYQSQPMRSTGRDLYFQFSSNNQSGNPTTYWANRSMQPALNVYPYANTDYQFFVFNYPRFIQDVGSFFNSLDIVGRFLEAATSALAAKLAQKYAWDRVDSLTAAARIAYSEAGSEDTEFVDSQVTMGSDGMSGGGSWQ